MKDFEYYRKRVAEEDAKARRTIGTEAELVHRALATVYAQRALSALAGVADNDGGPGLLQSA